MSRNGYYDLIFQETDHMVDDQFVKRLLKIKLFIKEQYEQELRYDYKPLYKQHLSKFIETLPE